MNQKRKAPPARARIVMNTINQSPLSLKQKTKRLELIVPAFEAFINGEGTVLHRREVSTVFNVLLLVSEHDVLTGDVDEFFKICHSNVINTANRYYGSQDSSITEGEVEVFLAMFNLYLNVLDNVGSGYIEQAEQAVVEKIRSKQRSESLHAKFSPQAAST